MYFKHLGAARYDPAEREAKHHRFAQVAALIRQGLRLPEEVGIPGVGLPPPVYWSWDWWAEPRTPRAEESRRMNRPQAKAALRPDLRLDRITPRLESLTWLP
jgi:hypothetical protein